jgi:TPP-dependent pyruvate/acetoin dehydrogenase alpha subunit
MFGPDEFRHWGQRDPIGTFEAYLVESGPSLDGKKRPAAAQRDANRRLLEEAEARVTAEVEAAAEEALESRRSRMPDPEDAVRGVYAEPQPAEKGAVRGGNGRDRSAATGPKRPPHKDSGRSTRKLASRPKRRLS